MNCFNLTSEPFRPSWIGLECRALLEVAHSLFALQLISRSDLSALSLQSV
jgi:hypothetical protein